MVKDNAKPHWTHAEKEYVLGNLGKLSVEEMGARLGKSTMSINLFLHRKRKSPRTIINDSLLLRLLSVKFINPEYFEPNREFFQAVRIGQKRWWKLYKGVDRITEEEYIRVAGHLQISLVDSFDSRQLNIQFEDGQQQNEL